MTARRMAKTLAAVANIGLLGLTGFATTRPGFVVEGEEIPLFVLMILAPIVSLVAMYWPERDRSAPTAPKETDG